MKEILWTSGFILVVLITFFLFVGLGWPGEEDQCIKHADGPKSKLTLKGNECFCEQFNLQAVLNNKPGVRQIYNTFSNFYIFFTIPIIVVGAMKQRADREEGKLRADDQNPFRRTNFFPIVYIQVAVFLGLGSMFFHASITHWGGSLDQLSMYFLVGFMIAYTMVRLTGNRWLFYIGYPVIMGLYLVPAILEAPSDIVIPLSMIPYAVFEFLIWWQDKKETGWWSFFTHFGKFWWIGVAAFALGLTLQQLSQTGQPLCDSTALVQVHGIWHILAGIMALMLYLYWREREPL